MEVVQQIVYHARDHYFIIVLIEFVYKTVQQVFMV
jgi:hypothetical protein